MSHNSGSSSKLIVLVGRTTAFPILLIIAFYERQRVDNPEISSFYETVQAAAEQVFDSLPRTLRRLSERTHRP